MNPRQPIAALALACALLASGCNASAISLHARSALVVSQAHASAGTAVYAARTAALDQAEADHPTDPEHDIAVREADAHWRPIIATIDAVTAGLREWVEAIDLARVAGGDDWLGRAWDAARSVLRLYAAAAQVAEASGVDVPELPQMLRDLIGMEAE